VRACVCMHICTLAETKIGRLVYAKGRSGSTVVTITLLLNSDSRGFLALGSNRKTILARARKTVGPP
jgi:hypothetical protein